MIISCHRFYISFRAFVTLTVNCGFGLDLEGSFVYIIRRFEIYDL